MDGYWKSSCYRWIAIVVVNLSTHTLTNLFYLLLLYYNNFQYLRTLQNENLYWMWRQKALKLIRFSRVLVLFFSKKAYSDATLLQHSITQHKCEIIYYALTFNCALCGVLCLLLSLILNFSRDLNLFEHIRELFRGMETWLLTNCIWIVLDFGCT